MTTHAWKCLTCGKSYRPPSNPNTKLDCPNCRTPLSAVTNAPLRQTQLPSPQPRVAASGPRKAGSHSGAASGSGLAPSGSLSGSRRPAGPAQAIAAVTSSSAWVPDPEPSPSPDAAVAAPSFDPRNSGRAGSGDWRHSPAVWASFGGVAVAVIVFAAFWMLRNHSTPKTSQAAGHAPTVAPQAKLAAAAPTTEPDRAATEAVPVQPAPAPAPRAVSVAPARARVVDLLKIVDPAADAIEGAWSIEKGELHSDKSDWARLAIPYRPPTEYDFRVEFSRTSGDNCLAMLFTHKNPAALVLFGWKNKTSGFQQVGGLSADKNSTGVSTSTEIGRRHTSVVKVRKESIEAWLDGKLLTRHSTNGSDLSARDWLVPTPLGLGSRNSSMAIYSLQLIEITGQGKLLR